MSRIQSFFTLKITLLLSLCCLQLGTPALGNDKVQVVASFSILGDMVKNIGGDHIELVTLVGVNSDAHVYSARPVDAKNMGEADLLVVNGLGFEGWFERLEQSSGFTGQKVVVTDHIPFKLTTTPLDEHHGHDHHDGDVDPHAWHSLSNAKQYVKNIATALMTVDPDHASTYQRHLSDYLSQLTDLEIELKQIVNKVPVDQRKVITSHDAFGYLAHEYGITFYSLQGVSTESEASAKEVAQLIRLIQSKEASAVFFENVTDVRLMTQISKETGAVIGGTLYSGALSEHGEPASTYIDLMRHNVVTIAKALSGS